MIGVVTCASARMPCALSSALVMGGCRGLRLNGAMVPPVLCGQYVCSPEQPLYSPACTEKFRFARTGDEVCPIVLSENMSARIDGVVRPRWGWRRRILAQRHVRARLIVISRIGRKNGAGTTHR